MERVFKFLTKELVGLHQAAWLLGVTAFLAQIISLLRDRLLSATFGAGPELDVYYAAFRIPDILFVTIASFVSVMVLVPRLVSLEGKENSLEEESRFISQILMVFSGVMVVACLVAYFLMPYLAHFVAPGFDSGSLAELTILSRVILLSPFLLGISNLLGAVTQVKHRFWAYTLSPLLYNFGIIIGVVFFYKWFGLIGLAWGVALGAILHLMIQTFTVVGLGFSLKPTLTIDWSDIKEIIKSSFPRTLTLSLYQLNIAVLVAMASLIGVGSVAVFTLAQNLQSVPLTIVGISYSVAAFPTLARLFSKGEKTEFVTKIMAAASHILFWSLPAIALFIVLRAHIVRIMFGSGNFNWTDTRLTAAALALFIVSVAAQSILQLLTRGYYATGNTKTPFFINGFSFVLSIFTAWFLLVNYEGSWWFNSLISLLKIEGLPNAEIILLPLAFSLASILAGGLMIYRFGRDFGALSDCFNFSLLKSATASLSALLATYIFLNLSGPVFLLETLMAVFLQGFMAGLIGVGTWLLVLFVLRSEPLFEIIGTAKSRFRVKEPLQAEPSEL